MVEPDKGALASSRMTPIASKRIDGANGAVALLVEERPGHPPDLPSLALVQRVPDRGAGAERAAS